MKTIQTNLNSGITDFVNKAETDSKIDSKLDLIFKSSTVSFFDLVKKPDPQPEEKKSEQESESTNTKDSLKSKKRKNLPEDSTVTDSKKSDEQKALDSEKTVFVGNVSIETLKDKKLQKKFKSLFKDFGNVKTVRFRSIAFSEPMPKKSAFVLKKFHSEKDTCNAYVLMETKEEAQLASKLNGTIFEDRHLRVDVSSNTKSEADDTKCTIFVGNLSFTAKEEDLWKLFEGCGDIEYVRIIRDSQTGLGKGFCYVKFKDSSSIPLALKLNKSKVDKRELRIIKATDSKKLGKKKTKTLLNKQNNNDRSGKRQKVQGARSLNPYSMAAAPSKKDGAYRRIKKKNLQEA
ncbi:hypothetical protein BB558_003890 [Smittium angustum]|uniref:Nucleolar protein 12 n=1 Tax=Smittium angustum TaxID=133377 RepID=A0A2U1J4M9_SMIAN|nr:hypothetical protein BB558_003890 [Smittium angustum]